MNLILRKLNNRAGETLVESMTAILVFTFASIIMLSMISSSADINSNAKNADRNFQEQMIVVEKADGTPVNGTVTFRYYDPEGAADPVIETASVGIYQAEGEDALYAYYSMDPTLPTEGEQEVPTS